MPGQINNYTAEQIGKVIDKAEVLGLDRVGMVQRLAVAQTEKKGRFVFLVVQGIGVGVECELSGRIFVISYDALVGLAAEAGVDRPTLEVEVSRG